ncbi:MAG: YIP1 family protein, partial [Gemmatimonadales bacterium]
MTEPTAPVAKSALWEDILEIFYAPAQVFARREGRGYGLPWLVLVVLTAVLFYASMGALQPIFDAESARQAAAVLEANPELDAEMIRSRFEAGQKFAGIAIIVFSAIVPFIVGLLLWLAGKVVGAIQVLGAAIMVAVFSAFPKLLGFVSAAIQSAFMAPESLTGQASVSLGPARFFDPVTTGPMLMAFLIRLDVFTIWATVLLAIGLKVTGKVSLGQAAIAAAIVWV